MSRDNPVFLNGGLVDKGEVELNTEHGKIHAHCIQLNTGAVTGQEALFGKSSEQFPVNDVFATIIRAGECESPPVRPEIYGELYRNSAMQNACVETKVGDTVGQGYRIRPRSELFPRHGDQERKEKIDYAEQDRVYELLDRCLIASGETFTEIVKQMVRDYEAEGQGYIEFSRNNVGEIDGIYSTKGQTMRIAKGGPQKGFWHTRGSKWRYFAPYTGVGGVKYYNVQAKELTEGSGEAAKSIFVPYAPSLNSVKGLSIKKSDSLGEMDKVSQGQPAVIRANEMMMLRKGTTNDTYYGEPDVHSAIPDYLIANGVKSFAIHYFDSATVPRIAIFFSGDTEITTNVIKQIEQFLSSMSSQEVMQQSLLVQLPEGVTAVIERLSSEHLSESEALSNLRDRSELYIAAANRTPLSAIPARMQSMGANRAETSEEHRRYVGSVIRPSQREVEERLNWVLRSELDVSEWVIDFDIPDLMDMKTKYQIWEIGTRQGWLTLNEVRVQINLPPIKGGDIPILRIPGQGAVPVSRVADIADRITQGAKLNDLMATGDMKTPPKGVQQPLEAKAIPFGFIRAEDGQAAALILPLDESDIPVQDVDEANMVAKFLEEVASNPDDAVSSLGL